MLCLFLIRLGKFQNYLGGVLICKPQPQVLGIPACATILGYNHASCTVLSQASHQLNYPLAHPRQWQWHFPYFTKEKMSYTRSQRLSAEWQGKDQSKDLTFPVQCFLYCLFWHQILQGWIGGPAFHLLRFHPSSWYPCTFISSGCCKRALSLISRNWHSSISLMLSGPLAVPLLLPTFSLVVWKVEPEHLLVDFYIYREFSDFSCSLMSWKMWANESNSKRLQFHEIKYLGCGAEMGHTRPFCLRHFLPISWSLKPLIYILISENSSNILAFQFCFSEKNECGIHNYCRKNMWILYLSSTSSPMYSEMTKL